MTTTIWTWGPSVLAYTAILVAVVELARRRLRTHIALQALLLALALFGTPDTPRSGFQTAKLVSITVPCFFFSVVRLAFQRDERSVLRHLRRPWIYVLAYAAMQLNILEAVIADAQGGRYFNALTGLVLSASVVTPFGTAAWRIETDTPKRDFLVALPRAWILLLTTWNLAFVYAEYPRYLAHVSCVLMAPLVYALALGRPDLWVEARVYTLAMSVIVRWGGHDFVTPLMNSEGLWNPEAARAWGLLNLLLAVCYVAYRTARRRRGVPQAAPAATPGS